MHVKILSLIMAILLAACCMGSCSNNVDDGTIEDVEIEAPAKETLEERGFSKAASPYDYEYKTFSVRKARMAFDVPTVWTVRAVNSRYIRIDTPYDDPFLPGVTINILCGYGEDVSENEMSQYTLNNHAYTFSNFFQDELPGLTYSVNGKLCSLRKYVSEDIIENGLDFAESGHEEDAATLISNNVVMVDKASNYFQDYNFIATYVKWDETPICFSAVAGQDVKTSAKEMLEYIASSIKYIKDSPLSYSEVSYEDFTTSVPSNFLPVVGAENIFSCPLDKNDLTSGMSVGVFKIEDAKTLTAENIARYYGETIASLTFDRYGVPAVYTAQAEKSDNGPDFTGQIAVNTKGENTTLASGSVFGLYSVFKTDYYVAEDADAAYLIAVIYQDGQKDLAKEVGRAASDKFQVTR